MLRFLVDLDVAALQWINGFARRDPAVDRFIEAWLSLDFLQGGFWFIFVWWLWFRRAADPKADPTLDRFDAVRLLAIVWGSVLVARALQIGLPPRLRPLNDPGLGFVLPYGGQPGVAEHYSSFPSDHAIVYAALATAIWARYRAAGALCFAWTLVFASLSRVYGGLHYPGDVVAGVVIGIVYMRALDAVPLPAAAHRWFDGLLDWQRRHPAAFYCLAVAVTFECMVLFEDVRIVLRFLFKLPAGLLS
ncbi:MAG: phosphatase PAP2 family protein [Reyranellaceae bacterium]